MDKRQQVATANYRARKKGLPATLTFEQWEAILLSYDGCGYCGNTIATELDHIVPLSDPDCPGTTAQNVTVACADCNRRKGSETWSIPAKQLKLW